VDGEYLAETPRLGLASGRILPRTSVSWRQATRFSAGILVLAEPWRPRAPWAVSWRLWLLSLEAHRGPLLLLKGELGGRQDSLVQGLASRPGHS